MWQEVYSDTLENRNYLAVAMVDIPEGLDDPSEIIIYGVESEQIEEENDAYYDMRVELGIV